MIAELAAVLVCFSPPVIDGDSMRCQGQEVRLWGIQAPEWDDRGGQASKGALRALTRRRQVHCRPLERDRYGRAVAQCFVGRTDLAREMVDGGHARDWPRFSRGYYAKGRAWK